MGTTVGKKSGDKQNVSERNRRAIEAQFQPQYIVEGSTVILFRSTTWGAK